MAKKLSRNFKCPVHFNGCLPCGMDVLTTGSNIDVNDLVHVVILPLSPDYTLNQDLPFFDISIKPEHPQLKNHPSVRLGLTKFGRYTSSGLDSQMAIDVFEQWYDSLGLPEGKTIVPVAHNYLPDRLFLEKWLGRLNYNYRFSPFHRDTLHALTYVDDVSDISAKHIPFPKMGLNSLCRRLGVAHDRFAGPIENARCHAEAYRQILRALL